MASRRQNRLDSHIGHQNRTVMNIRIATTDHEIVACYAAMRELRPHVAEDRFLSRIRGQENAGYRLAFVEQSGGVIAVAGFRVGENLAWGRFLYVDDLVTLPSHRSAGIGANLLSWLREFAEKDGCLQIHLDSGAQRKDAHRFYEREGMLMAGYHFVENLPPNNASNPDSPKRCAG
jgi:GNAT superfamily N-acetyltransferase